jgi:hypothetical protein
MKKMKFVVPALLVSSVLAFTIHVAADDEGGGCDHSHDCNIDGDENMEATVVLTATTNAPDGASGTAKLESENEDGNATTDLKLFTAGLNPGDYVLSITRISDGSTETLGTISVQCGCHDGEDDSLDVGVTVSLQHENDDGNDDQGDDDQGDEDGGTNHVCRTESELTLPADINPLDIAQITLSDADGNAILVGDFTNPDPGSTITFNASVQVSVNGSPAGTAHFQGSAHKGKWKRQFLTNLSGLDAGSSFDVSFNGQKTGQTKSNKHGQLSIRKVPSHIKNVRSLQLSNAQGEAVASAKF